MNELPDERISRGKIGMRILYTIILLIILFVMQIVIKVVTVVQFAILLITRNYSEPLRKFSNQAAAYVYKLIRYITLNENTRPFPFADFPKEMEDPEESVKFD